MRRPVRCAGTSEAAPETASASTAEVIQGLTASRNRLSRKLNELNAAGRAATEQLAAKDAALVEAFDCLSKSAVEFSNLTRLAQGAAAGVQFGVDRDQALAKILRLQERLENMIEVRPRSCTAAAASPASPAVVQIVRENQTALGAHVVRDVPLVWYGLASEVRLMGSFDAWTAGHLLSSASVDDSVFSRFEATVKLKPGIYNVKFKVDGKWRLAPGWPTETTEDGDTNNVLVVENAVSEPVLTL